MAYLARGICSTADWIPLRGIRAGLPSRFSIRLPTCGDVVDQSHFSSHEGRQIKKPSQYWTGRLVFS